MSAIIYPADDEGLTPDKFMEIRANLISTLAGRVREAYIFGSAGTQEMKRDSDVDLLLVVDQPREGFFFHRALDFTDLYDIYCPMDILVYTPAELAARLADADIGFWKSVRQTMRRIV